MGTPGTGVIKEQGGIGIKSDGRAAVFNASGECGECCGASCSKVWYESWAFGNDNGPWSVSANMRQFMQPTREYFEVGEDDFCQALYDLNSPNDWASFSGYSTTRDSNCQPRTLRFAIDVQWYGAQSNPTDSHYGRFQFSIQGQNRAFVLYIDQRNITNPSFANKFHFELPQGWHSSGHSRSVYRDLDTDLHRLVYAIERLESGNITYYVRWDDETVHEETDVVPVGLTGWDTSSQFPLQMIGDTILQGQMGPISSQHRWFQFRHTLMEHFDGAIGSLPALPY